MKPIDSYELHLRARRMRARQMAYIVHRGLRALRRAFRLRAPHFPALRTIG
jgi:hypothetical protein